MAFSKEDLYPKEDQIRGMYFRAVAHSARQLILRELEEGKILCVMEILPEHPVTGETISDHLRILREAGLVEYEVSHPYIYYWINLENLAKARKCCLEFFAFFERTLDEYERNRVNNEHLVADKDEIQKAKQEANVNAELKRISSKSRAS